MGSSRALHVVLVTLVASLLPLAVLPSSAATAPAVASAATSILAADDLPDPGADFPRLPMSCYKQGFLTSPCRLTTFKGRPTLVLWGDSHALMYLPALRKLARKQRVNLVAILFGGCPLSLPYPRSAGHKRTGCDRHNVESLAYVRKLTERRKKVHLLLNSFWSGYREGYTLTKREERTGIPSGLSGYHQQMARLGVERSGPMLKAIGRLRVPTDMIGQAATVPAKPRRCPAGREPYQCHLPRYKALPNEAGNRRWIRTTLMKHLTGKPRLIDTSPSYCTRKTCLARVRGVNTFYDDIHLGADLTRTMTGWFRPTFQRLVAR